MGLDITAYRKLSPATDVTAEQAEEQYETYWHPGASIEWSEEHWPGRGWPGRAEGIDANAVYTFAEEFGFSAGSYSGYGKWRRRLAEFAGYASIEEAWEQPDPAKPFNELLHFADNEGVIGPVVATKLAADFAEHDARASRIGEPWFYKLYGRWRRAFEMAADSGAVDFH